MAIIQYDNSPELTQEQQLDSLVESVQRALEEDKDVAISEEFISGLPSNFPWEKIDWNNIINKPGPFTPTIHQHQVQDIPDVAIMTDEEIEALVNA